MLASLPCSITSRLTVGTIPAVLGTREYAFMRPWRHPVNVIATRCILG